jgi:hypothetical protein
MRNQKWFLSAYLIREKELSETKMKESGKITELTSTLPRLILRSGQGKKQSGQNISRLILILHHFEQKFLNRP